MWEIVLTYVQYFGFVVGDGQVRPPEAKVNAINDFLTPTCRRALQRFIRQYSTVLAPLTDLPRKDRKFEWTIQAGETFSQIKTILCHYSILRVSDFEKLFTLTVDVSGVGAGTVLLQLSGDGVEHPVSYISKFNNPQ